EGPGGGRANRAGEYHPNPPPNCRASFSAWGHGGCHLRFYQRLGQFPAAPCADLRPHPTAQPGRNLLPHDQQRQTLWRDRGLLARLFAASRYSLSGDRAILPWRIRLRRCDQVGFPITKIHPPGGTAGDAKELPSSVAQKLIIIR